MRGHKYEPVKIMRLFHRIYDRNKTFIRQTSDFFEARSKSVGNCGHKHRTEAAAEPCRARLLAIWHQRRSEQCKAAGKG